MAHGAPSPRPPRKGGGCCGACCRWLLAPVAAALFAARAATRMPAVPSPPDVSIRLDAAGWERTLQGHLAEHGYAHIRRLLNRTEAEGLRKLAGNFCYGEKRKAMPLNYGGYTVPGFLELPDFIGARWLLDDERLHRMWNAVFNGAEYRFADHNDIGCDFVGVWHKDILRGTQKKFQVHDLWTPDENGQRHEIYKVLFYLQDHDDDTRALKVVPGSHTTRDISLERGYATLHPRLGDAVVFDQRLSHAGNSFYYPFGSGRMFMQVGFGKANIFTDEFEAGTRDRQKGYQAKMLAKSQNRGLDTFLVDVKYTMLGLLLASLPPEIPNAFADLDVKKYPFISGLILGSKAGAKK